MANRTTIQAAFRRHAQVLTQRPAIGHKTDITKVRITDGLTCAIEDGDWQLTADLAPQCGGNGLGPTPGTLGRAALGSCLAICYVMWAAELNVPLTQVEVEVQADSDARGMYGVGDTPAGYQEVRYVVSVTSPAPHEDIMRVLDLAEAHSPYVNVFKQPQNVKRDVIINRV
ncbi:MAG: OsmC family protein [bacterium]|nr:OsmC family protein [bacterium]